MFERNALDEYERAATKSRCEMAAVCASITDAIARDSSAVHMSTGRVDDVVDDVDMSVTTSSETVVVDSTGSMSCTAASPLEQAANNAALAPKPRSCRNVKENMGWTTRTYSAPPVYANGVPNDLAAHHEQLDRDGYTIVRDAIGLDLVAALLCGVHRLQDELGRAPAGNKFEGNHTTRTYNLLAHSEIWQQVPVHQSVLPLVEHVLGKECLISSLASIAIGPGERAQVLHADDQVQPLAKPHVATVCNSMWALTDFTEENGATRLVPGSHLWSTHDYQSIGLPHPDTIVDGEKENYRKYEEFIISLVKENNAQAVPICLKKGQALIWEANLLHGGTFTEFKKSRKVQAIHYFLENSETYYHPMFSNLEKEDYAYKWCNDGKRMEDYI